jgi:hypothetical protein
MAGVADLLGRAVYEGFARHRVFIEELFCEIEAGHANAVTSELTLAEALVKPLEIDRQDIADLYIELIQSSDHLIVIPIDRSILVDAAHYRARLGIKLPTRSMWQLPWSSAAKSSSPTIAESKRPPG